MSEDQPWWEPNEAELAAFEEDLASQPLSALEQAQADLTSIRALMHEVSVYDGLADVSPLVLMVQGLVADHQRLEQRIENALVILAEHPDGHLGEVTSRVIHVLRGGSPIPDTPEGLSDS